MKIRQKRFNFYKGLKFPCRIKIQGGPILKVPLSLSHPFSGEIKYLYRDLDFYFMEY